MAIVGALAAPSEGPALDLHEGIRDPRAGGCSRWPEGLWLVNESTGEMFPGLCRATNLCVYCRMRSVVETVEMLTLDAMEWPPTLYAVLTAREHLTRADCTDHLRQLRRSLRKTWPDVQWFVQVEFQRRAALHLNLLFKGVPVEQEAELHAALCSLWCSRVDALPVGQWVGSVYEADGVVRYLSKLLAHGLKQEQAPPLGWRGHRTSQTRGYLVRPASVMREEARRSLKLKRLIWRGLDAEAAELELAVREQQVYSLARTVLSDLVLTPGPGAEIATDEAASTALDLRVAEALEVDRLESLFWDTLVSPDERLERLKRGVSGESCGET